jgi:lipopolysaccharide/colanic/teichoic acid biosynthesis glycosyltransferase/glycosyltransferase involved in cell wall biosynthesis
MQKPRILVLANTFPELSQTYTLVEVEALRERFDVLVVSFSYSRFPHWTDIPHIQITAENERNVVNFLTHRFRPQLVHGHFLSDLERIAALAALLDCPYTVRTHAPDVIWPDPARWKAMPRIIEDERCLGILIFPFARPWMEAAGVRPDKIVDAYPVVDVRRFLDRSPNGEGVMHLGAGGRKKGMDDFIRLSKMVPEKRFDLYAIGERAEEWKSFNHEIGGRVNCHIPVDFHQMPAVYKGHDWLVYCTNDAYPLVGWPVALAEAWASGVGVCLRPIRPDQADYVGDAGFLVKDMHEAARIIAGPVPQEMRERAFAWAERFDVRRNLPTLTDLWEPYLSADPLDRAGVAPAIHSPPAPPPSRPMAAAMAKRLLDIVASLGGLALAAPLLLGLAGLIRLQGGATALVREPRLGKGGKPFAMVRLRTTAGSDAALAAPGLGIASMRCLDGTASGHDSHSLPIGPWLRRTGLDELPQLLNVLRGEMSLIGPRPLPPWEVEAYGPTAAIIQSIRPGLIGLWQVARTDPDDLAERVRLDRQYLDGWHWGMDGMILRRAVRAVLRRG